jgi:FliI/YscN family ATPase
MSMLNSISRLRKIASASSPGRVVRDEGTATAVVGLSAPVGTLVEIERQSGEPVSGEVIGFREELTLVCPLGDLKGVQRDSRVRLARSPRFVEVGDGLLGRAINALGAPVDGGPYPSLPDRIVVNRCAPPVLDQPRIDTPISIGIRAIDGLLPCGYGQRMGIFCDAGTSRSLLLAMLARHCEVDVNIIALIGRPGREVERTLHERLDQIAMERTVVVVANRDEPALVRLEAAATAASIAEYFRDRGRNVLLAVDSLTDFAAAQREIGLAAGETLNASGYPASLSSELPRLLERAGRGESGSITAFYTVLQEADDREDPLGDMARSLLDGHLFLSRPLESEDACPAVDPLRSVSRTARLLASREHLEAIQRVRSLMAVYRDHEHLIRSGVYVPGQNRLVDRAIRTRARISQYLRQESHELCTAKQARQALLRLARQRPARAA